MKISGAQTLKYHTLTVIDCVPCRRKLNRGVSIRDNYCNVECVSGTDKLLLLSPACDIQTVTKSMMQSFKSFFCDEGKLIDFSRKG